MCSGKGGAEWGWHKSTKSVGVIASEWKLMKKQLKQMNGDSPQYAFLGRVLGLYKHE